MALNIENARLPLAEFLSRFPVRPEFLDIVMRTARCDEEQPFIVLNTFFIQSEASAYNMVRNEGLSEDEKDALIADLKRAMQSAGLYFIEADGADPIVGDNYLIPDLPSILAEIPCASALADAGINTIGQLRSQSALDLARKAQLNVSQLFQVRATLRDLGYDWQVFPIECVSGKDKSAYRKFLADARSKKEPSRSERVRSHLDAIKRHLDALQKLADEPDDLQ